MPIPPHTVSGFSAGGSLAVIHQVAYSSSCNGAGILGGSPYGCNSLPDALYTCSGYQHGSTQKNGSIPWGLYVDACAVYAQKRAARGAIDPLSGLAHSNVFLFSGTNDDIVFLPVMQAVSTQFLRWNASVHSEFSLPAEHAWLVDGQTCLHPERTNASACCGPKGKVTCPSPTSGFVPSPLGCCGECASGRPPLVWWTPPVNRCGSYDLSGVMLRHVLGRALPLQRLPALATNLLAVNQTALLPSGWNSSRAGVDDTGWIYHPTRCLLGGHASCPMHIHYHCCGCNWRVLSSSYMLQNGLAQYAEGEGIVLIFPQASTESGGCFDWDGATGLDTFDTRAGVQLRLAISMMAGASANSTRQYI
jgi:hypothetical protein